MPEWAHHFRTRDERILLERVATPRLKLSNDVGLIHGLLLGSFFLLAFAGGLAELYGCARAGRRPICSRTASASACARSP